MPAFIARRAYVGASLNFLFVCLLSVRVCLSRSVLNMKSTETTHGVTVRVEKHEHLGHLNGNPPKALEYRSVRVEKQIDLGDTIGPAGRPCPAPVRV